MRHRGLANYRRTQSWRRSGRVCRAEEWGFDQDVISESHQQPWGWIDERSGAWREVERQSGFRQSSDRRSTAAKGALKLAASCLLILGIDISLPMTFSAQCRQNFIAELISSQSHQSCYSSASRQIHKRGSRARESVSHTGKRGFDVASEIREMWQVLLFDGNS
jgi:hypothetical protein